MSYHKKLIEVALPLEAINIESAREKSIRNGHPSTLHLWWSRKPLATARAVLFASLVDDPSEFMIDEESAKLERERLFTLIEKLVKWENSNNDEVIDQARLEIARSIARNLGIDPPIGKAAILRFLAENAPPVLDPFAGGGSIPFEAQRLGLRAYASDLNPVAVLINKALIEVPPKFINTAPVHPQKSGISATSFFATDWEGTRGLAEDIRYYGKVMKDEVEKQIGDFYPKIRLPDEYGGREEKVIAWVWARTVKCPNPACGLNIPLTNKWQLDARKGKTTWVEPRITHENNSYQITYSINRGKGSIPKGTVNRLGAHCLNCGTPVPFDYIRNEGKSKRIGNDLIAMVVAGRGERIYLPPDQEQLKMALSAKPSWEPDTELPEQALGFRVQLYGLTKHSDLFTPRQLLVITSLCDSLCNIHFQVKESAISAGMLNDGIPLEAGGFGATAYADAIMLYLIVQVFFCRIGQVTQLDF